MSCEGWFVFKFGDKIYNVKASEYKSFRSGDKQTIGLVMERDEKNHYKIEGVDPDLSSKVCEALYKKRQNLAVVELDMTKMCEFFGASREELEVIVRWYESNLISTKFILN